MKYIVTLISGECIKETTMHNMSDYECLASQDGKMIYTFYCNSSEKPKYLISVGSNSSVIIEAYDEN